MKVMAVETSGSVGGFAVVADEGVAAEVVSEVAGHHLEAGARMIDQVLRAAGVDLGDLAGVAVSLGPGSFTGLRIGLALAKGVCFGRGLPLVGVPTLDAMAEAFSSFDGIVVPVRDARRGEVYFCAYRASGGRVVRLIEYRALAPELVAADVGSLAGAGPQCGLVLVGDGIARYRSVLASGLGSRAIFADERLWHPKPSAVGKIGLHLLQEGRVIDVDSAEPIYVRASEAERRAANAVRGRAAGSASG